LRMEMYEVDDNLNLVVKAEFNNITFNAGIPDSEFIFEVPEGVQVVSDDWVPDAAQPAPVSEAVSGSVMAHPIFANWRYMSYRNLSISNAPALNQTARITYSIIPDRDMEILHVQVTIPDDGFELMDIDDTWPHTRYNWTPRDANTTTWYPTNLSKDTMYQFNATIKAVKTGNWTIVARGGEIYLSVSKDSAYIRDEPFPDPLKGRRINESELERMRANMQANVKLTSSSDGPFASDLPDTFPIEPPPFHYFWNGTAWIKVESPPKSMVRPDWNGTAWVERNNQS
ncbi:MAG: hypothetical protein C4B59_17635, partial [Candidatus Methanogaster sp.]